MSRSTLLARLRRFTAETPQVELPDQLPAFPRFQDPVSHFRNQLESVGGFFLDGRGEVKLLRSLGQLLEQVQAKEIFWECEEVLQKAGIPYRLRDPLAFDRGFLVWSYHHEPKVRLPLVLNSRPCNRAALASIQLSASSAGAGIAETGTVSNQVGPARGRLLPVLAPAHAVFLSEGDLVMNLADFLQNVQPGQLGSTLTLVTGPSRTADIEKQLVLGVHGPIQWFVILVE